MQTKIRVLLFCLIVTVVVQGQGTEPLTGKPFRFDMARSGTVFWSDSPLQQAVSGLAKTRRVPIWIDRRCDPTQELDLVSQDPLIDCLWNLDASSDDLDVAWSPEIVYVGTNGSSDRWATVSVLHREMVKKLSRAQRQKCLAEKRWSWPRLSNPQDLLRDLEAEWGKPFLGRERVHHDLWPAAKYSSLPFFVRLELLLAGFDLSFDFDEEGNLRIREMPSKPRLARSISITAEQRENVDAILKKHPQATLSSGGTKLFASWSVHEHVRRATQKRTATKKASRDRLRYTLQARDQKLGPFLEQLGMQLQITCEFSPLAKKQYNQMISFEVERVSFRQLVAAILKEADLEFTLEGDNLTVKTPAE